MAIGCSSKRLARSVALVGEQAPATGARTTMTRTACVGRRGRLLGSLSRRNSSMRVRIVLKSSAARDRDIKPSFLQHRRDLVETPNARVHFHGLVEAVGVSHDVAAPAAFAHNH